MIPTPELENKQKVLNSNDYDALVRPGESNI